LGPRPLPLHTEEQCQSQLPGKSQISTVKIKMVTRDDLSQKDVLDDTYQNSPEQDSGQKTCCQSITTAWHCFSSLLQNNKARIRQMK
jgi:hypothetical protein